MLDLLIQNATPPDGRSDMSVAVRDGKIVEIAPQMDAPAHQHLDAQGLLLSPPFGFSAGWCIAGTRCADQFKARAEQGCGRGRRPSTL